MSRRILSLLPFAAIAAPARAAFDEAGALARLAAPISAVAFLNMGMSLTDVVMIGWLGGAELAAAAVMSDAYSIVFYLTGGVVCVVSPLVAEARGAGHGAGVRRAVRHGLWAAAAAAVVAALLLWHMPAVLAALGLDAKLVALGTPYCRIMSGTVAAMLPLALWRHVLTALGRPEVVMWFTLAALPLNAVLNQVLMFGAFGLPALGIAGAAAASLLVAMSVAAGLTAYVAWTPSLRRYRFFRRLTAVRPATLWEMLRLGVPIGVASFAEVGVFLSSTLVVAAFAPEALVAHTIVLRTAGVLYAPVLGLGQAATVRIAHARGRGDITALRRARAGVLTGGCLVGVVYVAALGIVAPVLPWAFLTPGAPGAAQAAALAGELLLLLGLCELGHAPATAIVGILRGERDTRVPMLLSVIGQWGAGFGIAMLLVTGADAGAAGMWTGIAAGSLTMAALLGVRLSPRAAALTGQRPQAASGY